MMFRVRRMWLLLIAWSSPLGDKLKDAVLNPGDLPWWAKGRPPVNGKRTDD